MDGTTRKSRGRASLRFRSPARVAGAALIALLSGCRAVPGERLDDCRNLNSNLRTENARLRDQTVALTSQNQDMSERAVDDARRIRAQEEAIAQLERSVQAYQAERDELEVAVKELKSALADSAPKVSGHNGRALRNSRSEPGDTTPR